jgi:hypothetical protein
MQRTCYGPGSLSRGSHVRNALLERRHSQAKQRAFRIGFQRRKGRAVRAKEVTPECIVPIQDDHAILAEVESNQFCWRKHGTSVPGSGNGVLYYGKAQWIVCLEDCVVIRSTDARGESVINDVAGNKLIAIWPKADGRSF